MSIEDIKRKIVHISSRIAFSVFRIRFIPVSHLAESQHGVDFSRRFCLWLQIYFYLTALSFLQIYRFLQTFADNQEFHSSRKSLISSHLSILKESRVCKKELFLLLRANIVPYFQEFRHLRNVSSLQSLYYGKIYIILLVYCQ